MRSVTGKLTDEQRARAVASLAKTLRDGGFEDNESADMADAFVRAHENVGGEFAFLDGFNCQPTGSA